MSNTKKPQPTHRILVKYLKSHYLIYATDGIEMVVANEEQTIIELCDMMREMELPTHDVPWVIDQLKQFLKITRCLEMRFPRGESAVKGLIINLQRRLLHKRNSARIEI